MGHKWGEKIWQGQIPDVQKDLKKKWKRKNREVGVELGVKLIMVKGSSAEHSEIRRQKKVTQTGNYKYNAY